MLQVVDIPEDVFAAPDMPCEEPSPDAALAFRSVASFRSHMPNQHWGDKKYDRYAQQHGRRHTTQEEYHARREVRVGSAETVMNKLHG
jgi:hypothetical protein